MSAAAIDLLSDTVTLPPPAMRAALAAAEVGDDVYGEDPSVTRLERRAAARLEHEAALFVPSGTMANLLAFLAQAGRGRKALLGAASDAWLWEAGGASVLGGVVLHPVPTQPDGTLSLEDLALAAETHDDDAQCALPALVCIENTHCMSGGRVLPLDYLARLRAFTRTHDLRLHVDGARLWNAAVALGVPVGRLARDADSVAVCLSKGLAAPVGSLLAGPAPFVARARRLRKLLGGGMRQAGFLAAAGLYALDAMVDRLAEDHALARRLYAGLAALPQVLVEGPPPETNIVFWRPRSDERSVRDVLASLRARGVRMGELGRGRIRAVTHYGITPMDVEHVLDAVQAVLAAEPVAC